MKLIATLHNRRGDPLILLRLLRQLVKQDKIRSIGICWSIPSGETEPSWGELQAEEKRVQETLRSAVRLVHNSRLSLEAKTFLGRCYRSFQYEFMVALNLKRHDQQLRLVLLDEPQVREQRYKELGSPREFLREIATFPTPDQGQVLRARYAEYRDAYDNIDRYERMVLHPVSALLEISHEIIPLTKQREEYMAKTIRKTTPDIVLVRLIHCLDNLASEPARTGIRLGPDLPAVLGLRRDSIMKLSEADPIVGPLPPRD